MTKWTPKQTIYKHYKQKNTKFQERSRNLSG
nr:MAG TPA: hypothetical protein [Caudoviricetes sp.]DAO51566.1 MAG TPA: hypothetical protein [Caudoviricetes sp.]